MLQCSACAHLCAAGKHRHAQALLGVGGEEKGLRHLQRQAVPVFDVCVVRDPAPSEVDERAFASSLRACMAAMLAQQSAALAARAHRIQ